MQQPSYASSKLPVLALYPAKFMAVMIKQVVASELHVSSD